MNLKRLEHFLEEFIFNSRWLLAPFYIGLVAANLLLLVEFMKEFVHLFNYALHGEGGQLIAGILSLVDIVLIANLLLIIIFAGYETFVSKIDTANHVDRPNWMGFVDFSDLKMKVIGSIVAISGIELLQSFVNIEHMDTNLLAWKIGIHITFVFSGIGFALMDKISSEKSGHH